MDTRNEGGFVRRIRICDLAQGSPHAMHPRLSPENPAMVTCDGCYAHTVGVVLEIDDGRSHGHSTAPLHAHLARQRFEPL